MTFPAAYGGEEKITQLTSLNQFLETDRVLAKTRQFMIPSFDGTEVQAFVAYPPGFQQGKKYPAIVMIHGGPRAQYGFSFFHEFQYLAGLGYVVLYSNPRGGQGRGETWAESIVASWGDLDFQDIMAVTDWLEAQPYIDAKRIGVGGGSYGGFMTNWIVGHTHRFAAAITMRSVVDLSSFVGSSDIGYALRKEFRAWPWEDPELYRSRSPLTYAEKIRTPLLILHNEADLRCHIEQAEQLFVKMKVLGKKVAFVRFPDEPHGLSRHGRPDRRLARLSWIAKWFGLYLRKKKR